MHLLLDINLTPAQRSWVALVIAMLAVSYLLFRPKLKKKKDPLEQPVFSSLAQQRSVERQMQNLLVELSEMARQISAQLDTRAAKLEALIREADQKLAELRNTTDGKASGANASTSFAIPPSDAPPESPESPSASLPIDPRHAEVYALADSGRAPKEIASQLGRPSGEVELILALRPRN